MKTRFDVILDIAKVCHQTNKAYCETLGDNSQVDFDQAPDNIRQSIIDGVTKRLSNPDMTPEQMHANWMEFKIKDGWVLGPVKNLEKKTHPNLVPYNELPEKEIIKDYLVSGVIDSMRPLFTVAAK